MKTTGIAMLLTFVIATAISFSVASDEDKPDSQPTIDIKLTEESAVQIAETIFIQIYGKQVIHERPWKITEADGIYTIQGTMTKNAVGGVTEIKMRKSNAEVIDLRHGK